MVFSRSEILEATSAMVALRTRRIGLSETGYVHVRRALTHAKHGVCLSHRIFLRWHNTQDLSGFRRGCGDGGVRPRSVDAGGVVRGRGGSSMLPDSGDMTFSSEQLPGSLLQLSFGFSDQKSPRPKLGEPGKFNVFVLESSVSALTKDRHRAVADLPLSASRGGSAGGDLLIHNCRAFVSS